MVRYTSARLTAALASAVPHASQEDAKALKESQQAGSASLADVRLLSRVMRDGEGDDGHWVHQLLCGAEPVLPARREKVPPHPDLEPRLQRLRAAQEDRDYAQMMGSVMKDEDSVGRDAAEMSTFRSQLGVSGDPPAPCHRRRACRHLALTHHGGKLTTGRHLPHSSGRRVGDDAVQVGLNLIVSMVTMFIVGAYAGGTEEEPYGVRVRCGTSD